mgnify:FL=1
MISYYEDTLYPLQDKVLKVIDGLKTPFYLTGGTAISRCYYHFRYSDDLDFFVNNDRNFTDYCQKIINAISKYNLEDSIRTDTYQSFFLEKKLKIDFINDVAYKLGKTNKHKIFSEIDNLDNILSNKISAVIGRDEPKDVVDIWIIAVNEKIDWKKIFLSVNSKAVGIFPPLIAERLDTFPVNLLDKINWVEGRKPVRDKFLKDIQKIIKEII